jgi:glycosyltransferase involved in cell wall biosynthesis
MKAADLITCTTPRSAAYVHRETGRADMHIYPNCIDFADWPRIDLAQDDKIRVLWQASSSHFDDMWPLASALGRVHKKYDNVEVILFGSPYTWLKNQLVPARTISVGWVNYDVYIWRLSTLNADITLAPLSKTLFNESRSGIRMYESAACWKPAACLAEKWGPYRDEIIDGETGRLFDTPDDFERILCEMIEDRKKTKELAANAKDWVRTNRDPFVHVPKLIEAYQRLRDVRRAVSTPPPPLEELKNEPVPAVDSDIREREDADRPASVEAEHS